jgi:hypothetical protein
LIEKHPIAIELVMSTLVIVVMKCTHKKAVLQPANEYAEDKRRVVQPLGLIVREVCRWATRIVPIGDKNHLVELGDKCEIDRLEDK